jgi:uncharacterized protein (TIGR00251 family)
MFNEFMPFSYVGDNIILNIKVSPNASKNSFGKIDKTVENNREIYILKIFLTAKPQDGEANKQLQEILSKKLELSKSNIEIISGYTSKFKKILIKNNEKKTINILNSLCC